MPEKIRRLRMLIMGMPAADFVKGFLTVAFAVIVIVLLVKILKKK